jgi:hypothetical protein
MSMPKTFPEKNDSVRARGVQKRHFFVFKAKSPCGKPLPKKTTETSMSVFLGFFCLIAFSCVSQRCEFENTTKKRFYKTIMSTNKSKTDVRPRSFRHVVNEIIQRHFVNLGVSCKWGTQERSSEAGTQKHFDELKTVQKGAPEALINPPPPPHPPRPMSWIEEDPDDPCQNRMFLDFVFITFLGVSRSGEFKNTIKKLLEKI